METYAIEYLAAGRPKMLTYAEGKEMETGIVKKRAERLYAAENGCRHDDVADKKNHGGKDRAICIYPHDHYPKWEEEFSVTLDRAAFGENITAMGMTEENVCIGDTYRVGEAVIQVTQGRIPCDTINKRTGLNGLLARIIETGYAGFLCRVLQKGEIRQTDKIQLVERDPHEVSVAFALHTYFHHPKDQEAMQTILAVDALAQRWRDKLQARLARLTV
ncbi:MOSC domain-containing protein YiiM [Alteribacillus persepolensis]|uniref:MOSC domain-containing protein YiiM n=1 Tax=Alteribacillus persepolensis TaxID=568899 RepID=A0A1G8ESX4_9BACI|nr:MOSC domain-containing protein [Alteribacillus persepolensis]SDH73021.1 MOSC domain-containing protein YiiM [Alteribacillus persepolensis]